MNYTLTGSEAFPYGEVAAILSEVLGREITYNSPSLLAFLRYRGYSWGYIGVMAGIFQSTRRGCSPEVDMKAGQLLGRPPRTLRDFTADYSAVWSKFQVSD